MSFWRLYYHLVWATHKRESLITPTLEPRLYAYLVSKAAELEVFVYAINGCSEHVHLLVAIPPKHAVAGIVGHLKGASSHYINHGLHLDYDFAWQRGYGALSLGEQHREFAERYIRQQKQHHAENTINVWLERDTDLDEGPPDMVVKPKGRVKEETASYCVAEYPF